MPQLWTRNAKRSLIEEDGCSGERCPNPPVALCEFVDTYGWGCNSACCAGHLMEIASLRLCRRHTALCLVIGGERPALPDELHDDYGQTPTLLTWLGRGLNADVSSILNHDNTPGVISRRQSVLAGNVLRWEVVWQRRDSDLSIRFVMGGSSDPCVVVTCQGEALLEEAPEWLLNHRLSVDMDQDFEDQLRSGLIGRISSAIALGAMATTLFDLTGAIDTAELAGHDAWVTAAAS